MPIDLEAAERYVFSNARLLDRHRLAVLLHAAPSAPVLDALRAYRNPDGGFGHALEPDVRGPESEPVSTLRALEILVEVGALDDEMIDAAVRWIPTIADGDGGVPFVTPEAAFYPHAPWMVGSEGGSFLTFALAAPLWRTSVRASWLEQATAWIWERIEAADDVSAYWVKSALAFLDAVPDDARANAAIERLRPVLGAGGSIPVLGGTENERLTPLVLSPRPGARSRRLFTEEQIALDLDELEDAQQDDGGWAFDWLAWSDGQAVEWRGAVTVQAIATLLTHGRISRPDS